VSMSAQTARAVAAEATGMVTSRVVASELQAGPAAMVASSAAIWSLLSSMVGGALFEIGQRPAHLGAVGDGLVVLAGRAAEDPGHRPAPAPAVLSRLGTQLRHGEHRGNGRGDDGGPGDQPSAGHGGAPVACAGMTSAAGGGATRSASRVSSTNSRWWVS
jgi:hypothetical protein